MPSNEKIQQLRGDNSDFLENRQKAGEEYRQQAKEAGDRIKQTTASKVLRGAISGPIKAVNEAVEFGDDIYDYFAGNPYDNNDLIDIGKLGLEVEGDKEDWTYTVPQAVTQFLLPMGLVSGATRKAITNPWARNLLAGAVTDAVVQDPYEENLFNMLDKVPWLASPVTEILKAKTEEEIGVAEARLRQTGGGALLGETVTGVAFGLKQLKKAPKAVQERILKRLMNDENTRLVHATSDNIDNLGDEIIPNDPKVQTTFNPKFTGGGDPDVQKLILDGAEENKRLDAEGLWPYKRTLLDMYNSAKEILPKEAIDEARFFNARYGRGGEKDLAATVIKMNELMNKNAQDLHKASTAMSQSLAAGNIEGFKAVRKDLEQQVALLRGIITLNKPMKTIPAQTLAANKIGGGVADTAATIDDLAKRTPKQKAVGQSADLRGFADEGGKQAVEDETLKEILDLAEKGDLKAMKKLRVLTNKLQAASGDPEALRRMAQEGPIIKGLRVSNELFINSILSGPETHAVNILSTALNTIARPIEQVAGAAVTGNTQGMMRGAKELIYLTQSIGDSLKMAKAAFRIEDNIINPGAMIQDASRFNVRMDGEGTLANIINTFGTIQRLPSRFLLAEDEFFKSMNFRAYVKASAWENGVNKGLDGKQLKTYIQDQFDKTIGIVNEGSMKNTKSIEIAELYEKAQQYAAETTFTADLPAGSFGKKLQGVASHPAGRVIFPFVRTPLNIFKAQVRRTPGVNLILQEYRQALKSTDPSVAARARGEMVIGGAVWSVAGITAYAINDDFSELAITGGGPSDYTLLNQKKATGWQPYSFRFLVKGKDGQPVIGQDGKPEYKYVSFKRLDPWSSFLMMAADAAAITGQLNQQDRDDFGVAASVALGRNITNKTYLQGITELSDLLQKPYKLESWLARRAAATVNPFSSLGRSGAKYVDPTIMDKRVRPGDEGMVILRKFHNELAATIPGYGAGMKPIQNFITGSLVEYPPGYGPDIMNIMNPIKETNSVNNLVLTTLDDIQAKITPPKDELFGGVKLDRDQYSDLVNEIAFTKIGGVRMVHALNKTMKRKDVQALLATARGENIDTTNQDTSVAAQEKARADAEDIFRKIINAYKKQGREQWIRKPENRELALKYDEELNAINEARNNSVLENFKQLQGVSN